MHEDPVGRLLAAVVDGHPPPADSAVTVLPQPPGPVAAILAFAAHHVVAADVEAPWVHDRLPPGDLSAPVGPAFVAALGERLGVPGGSLDVVLAGRGTGRGEGDGDGELIPVPADADHPRVARSLRYRSDLQVYATGEGDGLLVMGRGLAGRWEASFEVDEGARRRGLGRALAAAALGLVAAGEPVFVQVAPGNVPSLRAVLATGAYDPIGAEILFATGA